MAKVVDNLVTEGLSGKLGKRLVFRKGKGGKTLLTTRPVFSEDRSFSEAQMAQQEAFGQAIDYARGAKTQPIYIELAKGTPKTAYNIAVEDWFGQPEILQVKLNGWTGGIGQTIRVQAKDDVEVTHVRLSIGDGNGTVYEQGEAVPSETESGWWVYTTTTLVPMTPAPRLDASAEDRPGNIGAFGIMVS